MTILIGILIYLYIPKQKSKQIRIITESHYVLYDADYSVGIKFFSEQKNLIQADDIEGGFIYNADQSIKFQLEDMFIKKIHDERYLDILHFGYELHFKLPDITDSYFMERLYMKLILDGNSYEFFLGSLYVEYPTSFENHLHWYGLEGIKDEGPKLSQILIDVSKMTTIESIYVGPHLVSYFEGDHNIVVDVLLNEFVFTSTFLKVYNEFGVTYLPNFTFFMNYELLASGLHYNYVIK